MKVKEALFGSFKMLKEKPKFVLPMILPIILGAGILELTLATGVPITGVPISTSTTGEAVAPPEWYLAMFVLMILIFVVSILVYGMYPSMVKDHIEKKELNLKTSFLFACHKFWSLLGASLLAILIIFGICLAIGFAVIVPLTLSNIPIATTIGTIIEMIVGFLIIVFFYYIFPAIIMDDLKAFEGIGKSWETGKKNYLFTLLICLIPGLINGVIYGLLIGLPAYLGAGIRYISILSILYSIIGLFIGTWMVIIQSYAYYGLRA
jgi:hypothetical protein